MKVDYTNESFSNFMNTLGEITGFFNEFDIKYLLIMDTALAIHKQTIKDDVPDVIQIGLKKSYFEKFIESGLEKLSDSFSYEYFGNKEFPSSLFCCLRHNGIKIEIYPLIQSYSEYGLRKKQINIQREIYKICCCKNNIRGELDHGLAYQVRRLSAGLYSAKKLEDIVKKNMDALEDSDGKVYLVYGAVDAKKQFIPKEWMDTDRTIQIDEKEYPTIGKLEYYLTDLYGDYENTGPVGQQEVVLEAFAIIKELCDKNEIPFYLLDHSLLGAVQYDGFIPWEEEISLGMTVENYNRFSDLADKLPEEFRWGDLFKDRSTPRIFGKLSYKGKECISVFPMVKTASNMKKAMSHVRQQKWWKIIYHRKAGYQEKNSLNFYRMSLKTFSIYHSTLFMSLFFSEDKILENLKKARDRYKNTDTNQYLIFGRRKLEKVYIKSKWIETFDTIKFCGYEARCFSEKKKYLKQVYGDYEDSSPRNHQLYALEAMKAIDKMCRKHNITYYLLAGSVLGAVRHKGFIPWDDDIDIGMKIDDLDRFCKLCEENLELPKDFFWSHPATNPTHPRFFGKVIYKGKPCIDVFPLPRTSDDLQLREKHWLFRKKIFLRYLRKIGYKNRSLGRLLEISTKNNVKYFYMKFTNLFMSRERIIELADKNMRLYEKEDTEYHINFYSKYEMEKELIKSSYLESTQEIFFEDTYFTTVNDIDSYLTHLYGDYMAYPPPEYRQAAHSDIQISIINQ